MNQKIASVIAVLITAAWGSSFILMKNVADSVPALGFLSLRFGLSAIILALIFFKKLCRFTKKTILHSLILGILLVGYMIFQIVGLRDTSASNSAFITSLSVLIVPFLSALFLKKMPGHSNWVGVFLALLGLVFITGIYQGLTALTIGDVYTFLCALCVAAHIIVADRFLKEDDSLLLGIGQIFAGAIISIVIWHIKSPHAFLTVAYTPTLLTSVVLTALFCTCFAFTAQIIVQKNLPPARLAVIFTLEPVFAYVYALLIPGTEGVTEPLLVSKVFGCVLVLSGMVISESGLLSRTKKPTLPNKKELA
ncbi:MAG: DMT family transporter [Ruminococcaceae bacterium]|nr:DMT family transporter [Oscillospiraceae bacterium]